MQQSYAGGRLAAVAAQQAGQQVELEELQAMKQVGLKLCKASYGPPVGSWMECPLLVGACVVLCCDVMRAPVSCVAAAAAAAALSWYL
jgi:hypothetical protein